MDRFNRLLLLLLGALLTGAGGGGLLAAVGAFDQLRLAAPLPPGVAYLRLVEGMQTRPAVGLAALFGGALAAMAAGLALAVAQLMARRLPRLGTVVIERQPRGTTTLEPHPFARATAADCERLPGVVAAHARLLSFDHTPHLWVELDLARYADPHAVRAEAEAAYRRVCEALGVDEFEVDLRLRFTDATQRVR